MHHLMSTHVAFIAHLARTLSDSSSACTQVPSDDNILAQLYSLPTEGMADVEIDVEYIHLAPLHV